jgi:hypothetical protein
MSDKTPAESDAIEKERLLGTLRYLQERVKLQREIMDRWFGYYLLIIGAPFPILAGLFQIESIRNSLEMDPTALAPVPIFFLGIGLLFLGMHIRQRINWLKLMREWVVPTEAAWLAAMPLFEETCTCFRPERFGADFFFGLVYCLINSAWLVAGLYLIVSLPYGWIAAAGVGALVLQSVGRTWLLRKHESRQAVNHCVVCNSQSNVA